MTFKEFMWTYHRINRLEGFGEAVDDERELVFGDIDETFLVLLHVLDGLGRVQACSHRQLQHYIILINSQQSNNCKK